MTARASRGQLRAVVITAVLALAPVGTAGAVGPVGGSERRVVLLPGAVQIHAAGRPVTTVGAPDRLDLLTLTTLVDDAELIERQADGGVDVRVPIEQRPGSRLALNVDTVTGVRFTGGGRLLGSGAILSINGVEITATGRAAGTAGNTNALIGYDRGSGVRMTRVQINDARTGPGAGPVIDLTGSQFRIVSTQVSGGAGGVRLASVRPADLIGVHIERSRGPGLLVGGRTGLRLRDVTIAANAGDGLTLNGAALTVQTAGAVTVSGNRHDLTLRHTRGLDLGDVRTGSAAPPPRAGPVTPAIRSAGGDRGRLDLRVLALILGALAAGAIAMEVVRIRRQHEMPHWAPDHVLNR